MWFSPASAALAGNVPEEYIETTTTTNTTITTPQQPASKSPAPSPPLIPDKAPARAFVPDNITPLNTPRSNQPVPGDSPPHANSPKSFSRPLPPQRPKPAPRTSSKSGGIQMVLDGESNWSALAEQNLS